MGLILSRKPSRIARFLQHSEHSHHSTPA
jgi:hypothetical protein